MVVRDFRARHKRQSILETTRDKGRFLVKHFASTDGCPSCTAEALTSLDDLYKQACDRYSAGRLATPEFREVEAEVKAIARRLTAIAAFAQLPDVVVGGRQ